MTVNTATSTITRRHRRRRCGVDRLQRHRELSICSPGIGDLTITTTGADDTVVVTPGLAAGANSGTVQSSGAVPQIAFVNSGTFTANLGGGDDALVVNGSSDAGHDRRERGSGGDHRAPDGQLHRVPKH